MRKCFVVWVAAMGLVGSIGCVSAFPKDQGKIIAAMLEQMKDQGVLESWTASMDGDLWEPGMAGEVCIRTAVRLVGVRGHVDLGTEGGVTGMAPGLREALLLQLGDARTSPEQRMRIIEMLGGVVPDES